MEPAVANGAGLVGTADAAGFPDQLRYAMGANNTIP
jgi:hypothetical protein